MGTLNVTGAGGTTGHPSNGRVPYLVENTIDLSAIRGDTGPDNGDVLQVPMFLANADMNVYNLWLPDTRMYREAVRIHKEFDACTKEMLIETEFKHDDTCPCANCNLSSGHGYVDEEEIVQDEVDPVLAIS